MRCRMRCWDIWRCWWPIKKAPFVPVNSMLVDVDEQTDTFSVRVYSTNEDDLHYVQLDWTSWDTVSVSYVRKWDNEYNHNIFTQSVVNSMAQAIEQSYQDWTLFDWIYTFTDDAREAISDYFAEPITPESTAEMQQALWSMPIVEDWYYTIKFVSNNTNYWTVDLELVNIRQWLERYIYASKEEHGYNTIEWHIDTIGWEYEDRCAAVPEYSGSEEYTYVFDKFTYDTATWTQVPFEQNVLIDRDMTIYANFRQQPTRYSVHINVDPEKWEASPDNVIATYGDMVSWEWGDTITIWNETVQITLYWAGMITDVLPNHDTIIWETNIDVTISSQLISMWPINDIEIEWVQTPMSVSVPLSPVDAEVQAEDFSITADNCTVENVNVSWWSLEFTLVSEQAWVGQLQIEHIPTGVSCDANITVIAPWPEHLYYDWGRVIVPLWWAITIEVKYTPEDAINVLDHVTVWWSMTKANVTLAYAHSWVIVVNISWDVRWTQRNAFYLDDVSQFSLNIRVDYPPVEDIRYEWWPLELTEWVESTFTIQYDPIEVGYDSINKYVSCTDKNELVDNISLVSAEDWEATYSILSTATWEWIITFFLANGEDIDPMFDVSYKVISSWPKPVEQITYSWWVVYMPNTDTPYEIFADVEPLDANDWSNVDIVRLSWTDCTSFDIVWVHDGHIEFMWILITWWGPMDRDTYSVQIDWVEQFQITLHWWNGPVVGWVEEVRSFFEDITPNAIKQGMFEFIINYYPITAPDAMYAIQVQPNNPNIASIDNVVDNWDWTMNISVSTYDIWTAEFHVLLNWNAAFILHLNVTDTGEDNVVELYKHRTRWTIKHNLTYWTIELADNRWNTVEILDRDLWADDYYDPSDWHSWVWAYFQWWNNYPFTNECLDGWTCLIVTDAQRDATWYGPGNYYYNNEVIIPEADAETWEYPFYTRDSSLNTNLRWYEDIQTDPALWWIANRWPCKPFTFVPSTSDATELFKLWNYIYTWTESTNISSDNISTFCSHTLINENGLSYRCCDAAIEPTHGDRVVWGMSMLNNALSIAQQYDINAIFLRPFSRVETWNA